ncbi:hypothetical protein ACLOJK_004322 [Asimina triloba]
MAGSVSEDNGAGRFSEGLSSGQRCQSGDSQGEWRSSEQVENGTPSTSPPYWDTDDDDDGQFYCLCLFLDVDVWMVKSVTEKAVNEFFLTKGESMIAPSVSWEFITSLAFAGT